MAPKPNYQGPLEALERYESVVAANPDVPRKGAKTPYTSRNGHMFSFLNPEGTMALRLSDKDRAEFCERYDSGPVEQYGRTMNGYVRVPDSLLAATPKLEEWFNRSYDWIGTLKPKPTSKKKKSQ